MAARASWRTTTQPASEPVTKAAVKAELGISAADTTQDPRIERLITAARDMAERYTGRAFINQGITYTLDRFPSSGRPEEWWDGAQQAARSVLAQHSSAPIYLPRPPYLTGITVTYTTPDGQAVLMDPSAELLIDAMAEPARVMPAAGRVWPTSRAQLGVSITYSAGYGSNATDVPAAITEAIMSHVIDAFTRPNAAVSSETIDNASVAYGSTSQGHPLPGVGLRGGAQAMLEPYRIRDAGLLFSPYAIP